MVALVLDYRRPCLIYCTIFLSLAGSYIGRHRSSSQPTENYCSFSSWENTRLVAVRWLPEFCRQSLPPLQSQIHAVTWWLTSREEGYHENKGVFCTNNTTAGSLEVPFPTLFQMMNLWPLSLLAHPHRPGTRQPPPPPKKI